MGDKGCNRLRLLAAKLPTPERCPGSAGSSSLGNLLLVLQLPPQDNTPAGSPQETRKKHVQHLYFQPTPITLSSPSTHQSCNTLRSADHWGLQSHTCKDVASFSLSLRSSPLQLPCSVQNPTEVYSAKWATLHCHSRQPKTLTEIRQHRTPAQEKEREVQAGEYETWFAQRQLCAFGRTRGHLF